MSYDVTLACKSVWYYCDGNETAFFEWLESIPCIEKVDGVRDELYLYIKNQVIPDDNLRELLALFYRYNIDMQQLSIF